MTRPIAFLRTSPHAVRLLVRQAEKDVLKAVLPRTSSPPHPRALATLLESLALWHQRPVRAVVAAADEATWCQLGLLDALGLGADEVHFTVEVQASRRGRRPRIEGLGDFRDLRQLELGGGW